MRKQIILCSILFLALTSNGYVQAGELKACAEAAALWTAWAAQKAPFELAKQALTAAQGAMSGLQAGLTVAQKAADVAKKGMDLAQKGLNEASGFLRKLMDFLANNTFNIKSIGMKARLGDAAAFKSPRFSVKGNLGPKPFDVKLQLDPNKIQKAAASLARSLI